MKWTNSYRSFGLKTKRSTGLKTIEHKHIAIIGLPSCEMRSQMRSHNGPPRGIHSYLCEMKTVEIKPFLRFPNC